MRAVPPLLVAMALGCGPRGENEQHAEKQKQEQHRQQQPQLSGTAPRGLPSCAERAAALRKALLDQPVGPVSIEPLPRVVGGHPFADEDGLTLVIKRDDTTRDDFLEVQGRRTAIDGPPAARFIERFVESFEKAKSRPPAILLSAAPETPAGILKRVIAQVPERLPLRLVVADAEHPLTRDPLAGTTLPPGAGAWSSAWVEKLRRVYHDPMAARDHLAEGLRRDGGSTCTRPFADAFAAVGDSAPADSRTVMADRMSAALEECRCAGVDPAFEMILVLSYRAPGTPVRWLELPRNLPVSAKTVGDVAAALARP